jgi:hypothetical protein
MFLKKKVLAIVFVFCLILILFTSTFEIDVKAAELLIFEEDFESYAVGSFPTVDRWTLWYPGMGYQYQIIVDDVSHSEKNSLQLLGDYSLNWAAYAARKIDTCSPIIGFNVSVRVESLGGGERDIARVGFASLLPPNRVTNYAPVLFKDNGTITVMNGIELQTFVTNRWYQVSVILNRTSENYSVWIDHEIVAENLPVITNHEGLPEAETETTWDIEAFALSQNYYSRKVYFDDVKVFSTYDPNPYLELHPSSGIAQTTLVGSGFAPISRIFAVWNGTDLHTVPEPLIANEFGNFTAIISTLNQTIIADYEVTVADEFGNEASAIFTMIPEFPSWILLLFMLVAVGVASIVYKRGIQNLGSYKK